MTARTLLLAFLIGALTGIPSVVSAEPMPSAILSNQELSAEVTKADVTLTARSFAQGNQDIAAGIAGSRYGNFSGIETVSIDGGNASIVQAATSLSVRAGLTLNAGPPFAIGNPK